MLKQGLLALLLAALVYTVAPFASAQDNGSGDQIVKARIELDERIGKGAIRSRRPNVYQEILRPKQ